MDRLQHLRALLLAHAPADPREGLFRDEMMALAEVGDAAMDRLHFDPGHFTASAFVLSPDGAEVLLILHGKLGIWVQPGGHVDPEDSDVLEAALREAAEETGIPREGLTPVGEGLFDLDVHVIPPRKGDPAHRHFDLRVLLRASTRTFEAGSDARAGRWVPLGEVEHMATDESVMRAIRKIESRR